MVPLRLLELLVLGFGAGTFGAILGLGGGVIIVPVLTLLFSVPIEKAIGTSLVSVIATSSGAAAVYVQEKLTDIRLGMSLELGTTLGAVTGAFAVAWLGRDALATLFGLFLIYGALSMLRKLDQPEGDAAPVVGSYEVRRMPLGMAVSYLAGGISGMLGVGGGPIKVPLMFLAMGVPLRVATATSNFMIGVTAAASAFIYYSHGRIEMLTTAPVVVGVFFGSMAGSHLARRLRSGYVILLFVLVMFYLALEMLLSAFHLSLRALMGAR